MASSRSAAIDVSRSATSGARPHVLEIVEHQHRRPVIAGEPRARIGKSMRRGVRHAERFGDGRRDERGDLESRPEARTRHGWRPRRRVACASSSASRVFPDPPGPVSVIRRAAGSASQCRSVFDVAVTAEEAVSGQRQRTPLGSSTAAASSRRPALRQQRVAGRRGQIERRGQRAHGVEVGAPSFAALERADGMNREPGDGRELLLREACGLAERLELGERPASRPISIQVTAASKWGSRGSDMRAAVASVLSALMDSTDRPESSRARPV